MNKSAIVLAGGFSKRLGSNKGLTVLLGKPIIKYVLDAVDGIVDEKIVVVNSKALVEVFAKALGSNIRIVADKCETQSPLVGALTGFSEAYGKYALLLPCDTPMVSREVLALLLELCIGRNAVIPRWPKGYIEPLQAAYRIEPALEAAEQALNEGKLDMRSMIEKLRGIRYISTLVLQQFDPELKMFFNINTPMDLKKAEQLLKTEK
ncbi:MAG: molybdenum cofactor guanylyltransferase [Nitrososphaerota archaeon]|nr:molybdenum cofactor guanylyltransferase [Candidatus Bathyarchaeota archaeon]MDW8024045.1 molybdenum cofactor guanylyltransferase [Nitrososphaerota archaeon]MDW8040562.1 molybdenum cofactor guanylyltransferase [Nitrososphaerota archaeon]